MKKLKDFCKKHKGEIILTGCLAGAIVYGFIVRGQLKKEILKYAGQSLIGWKPNGSFFKLEEVKEILDLNADNQAGLFAVVREGHLGKDVYSVIRLNGSNVIEKMV
jgi:hypothetical protein